MIEWSVPRPAELPTDTIVGGVLGAALFVLLAGLLGFCVLRRRREPLLRGEARLVDSDRLPLEPAMSETTLACLPIRMIDESVGGLFSDPVIDQDSDADDLREQRQMRPRSGLRLLQVDTVYADVLVLRNASTVRTHSVTLHLPEIAPQYVFNVEPLTFRVRPGEEEIVGCASACCARQSSLSRC